MCIGSSPLIVTLAIDAEAQGYFDALRARHFPPERNYIPAHLTLFHALPGEEETSIRATLTQYCRQPRLLLEVSGVIQLGRGVAFRLESDRLRSLHRTLQQEWTAWLTAQDRQQLRPHIVIQNKVETSEARALYAQMACGFRPFSCSATGLTLWRYLGGPWEWVESHPFMASDRSEDQFAGMKRS